MLAKVGTCAVVGLEGALVEVEVDIGHGLPAFSIVGLPDTAVTEAKERVRAAVKNSGCIFPLKRITVNLAPADLRKEGPAYDLPIAMGLLLASEQVAPLAASGAVVALDDCLFLGELGLDGTLRHTHGILPMVALARDRRVRAVFVPAMDAAEAALVEEVAVYPVETLAQLVAHLRGEAPIAPYLPDSSPGWPPIPRRHPGHPAADGAAGASSRPHVICSSGSGSARRRYSPSWTTSPFPSITTRPSKICAYSRCSRRCRAASALALAEAYCRIRGFLSTLRKRQYALLQALQAVFTGRHSALPWAE